MEFNEANVKELLGRALQPKVRVDGGDVRFECLEGDEIHLGAGAECSVCPAMPRCLKWWLERKFRAAFGPQCRVVLHSRRPYYKRGA